MDIRKTEKAVHDRNNQFSSEGRRAGENGFHRIKDCYAHVSKDDEDNKACRNRRRQVTFNEKRKDNGIQNGHSQGSNEHITKTRPWPSSHLLSRHHPSAV
uniref:Uncharacterized protein n=1 Tax=Ditylum brightwellii TaxID=49249 RepID=A0A7S4S6T5_9STRA